jgi:Family of unknown function (DUF6157)
MKIHSTNYTNTLIQIADDCPTEIGEIPPVKGASKTVANMQFDMINKHPYKYTSDEVLFTIFAQRNDISKSEMKQAKEIFFSKGQACLRASPLTKRYGWGIHHNSEGKIALLGSDTKEYKKLSEDKNTKIVKAMKSSK